MTAYFKKREALSEKKKKIAGSFAQFLDKDKDR